MEKEIEKLKQSYLHTKAPNELISRGFEDVLIRKDRIKRRALIKGIYVGAISFVVIVSSLGLISSSKPNTIFYPVKTAAQIVVSKFSKSIPYNIERSVNNYLETKKVNPTIKPTITQIKEIIVSITPTPIKDNREKTEETKKEVKGESTVRNEEIKSQNQENHSNENVNNSSSKEQKQESENHGSENSSKSEDHSNGKSDHGN